MIALRRIDAEVHMIVVAAVSVFVVYDVMRFQVVQLCHDSAGDALALPPRSVIRVAADVVIAFFAAILALTLAPSSTHNLDLRATKVAFYCYPFPLF